MTHEEDERRKATEGSWEIQRIESGTFTAGALTEAIGGQLRVRYDSSGWYITFTKTVNGDSNSIVLARGGGPCSLAEVRALVADTLNRYAGVFHAVAIAVCDDGREDNSP